MNTEDEFEAKVGHGEKYTRKKAAVITGLLTCSTQREAARQTGVSEKTISRWRKKPDFEKLLHEEQMHSLREGVSAVAKAVPDITKALLDVATDRYGKGGDRVRAGKVVLDTMCKLVKSVIDSREPEMALHEELVDGPEDVPPVASLAYETDTVEATSGQAARERGESAPLVGVNEKERQTPEARSVFRNAGAANPHETTEPPNEPAAHRQSVRRLQMSPDVRNITNIETETHYKHLSRRIKG